MIVGLSRFTLCMKTTLPISIYYGRSAFPIHLKFIPSSPWPDISDMWINEVAMISSPVIRSLDNQVRWVTILGFHMTS